jgi:hypothetical protein
MSQIVRRGDVFWANLDPTIGVEIKKTRPVIVMSNDVINQRSRLVIVVPLTTSIARLSPSHVLIPQVKAVWVRTPRCSPSRFGPWISSGSLPRSAPCQAGFCG